MRLLKTPGGVAMGALVIASLATLRLLVAFDMDPTAFTAFGDESTAITEYAETKLGREVLTRPPLGHDGKFFFVQANDPWILHPEMNADILDRPIYRSQRMFYPLLAGGGGLFSPEVVPWALIAVNVLALGAGTFATARVAVCMGMSSWWGLAFLLNLGFISDLLIDGAGILAACLAFGALAFLLKGDTGRAVLLMALSALTREAMLIAAVGSAWWLWRHERRNREAVLVLAGPVGAVFFWAAYLRLRIVLESGAEQVQEVGWPLQGFIGAMEGWRSDPTDAVAGIAIMALLLLFLRRALISQRLVGWSFLGFVGLGLVFTQQVWQSYFDSTRAIAPVITAFALLVFAPDRTPSNHLAQSPGASTGRSQAVSNSTCATSDSTPFELIQSKALTPDNKT